jgi:hypothetical protein
MASAEFSQFVATVLLSNTSTLSAFKTSPGIHTVFPILPAAFTIRVLCAVIGFWLGMLLSPCLWPYMRFLFVRPELCPWWHYYSLYIQYSSDSAIGWTISPLANPSHCRADSGLLSYRMCARRVHMQSKPSQLRL